MSNLLFMLALSARCKVGKFLFNEDGEVNIVATVVLIGIAVALALVFRKAISELITSLLANVATNANEAIKPE